MLNQYWFSIAVEPVVTIEQLQEHSDLFSNCFYPIGNEVDGRMLCRVLADDFESIRVILDSIGKETILCGGQDEEGYWLDSLERNDAEFEKFMQSRVEAIDGIDYTITPADNTSGGRPAFKEGIYQQ
jgi:hypothetical protein